jgi:multiple sugar transport system permease protein
MARFERIRIGQLLASSLAVAWVVPVIWVLVCSFKTDLLGGIPQSFSSGWAFKNFAELANFGLSRAVWNSLIVGILSTIFCATIGLMFAFGLLCRPRPFVRPLLLVVSGRTIPAVTFLLPQFLLARYLGMTESIVMLALVHCFNGLSLVLVILGPFVLRAHQVFFDQARADGATEGMYLKKILLPLLWKPVAFAALIAFLSSWTDYLYASIFTVGRENRTLPVMVGNFVTSYGTAWGPMYATVTLSFLTSAILVILTVFVGRSAVRRFQLSL